MTNAQIILGEQYRLFTEGVLKATGNKIQVMNFETGQLEEVDEIQPIHTFVAWKKMGYAVKKGEKAITKFAIWKYAEKKHDIPDDADEATVAMLAQPEARMFLKVSAFFTDEQVERIQ